MKKILILIFNFILIFCAGCTAENLNDIFSGSLSDKKEESVIEPPDLGESTETEYSSKEDSSDDSSSLEKEETEEDEYPKEPPQEEDDDNWTFNY